MDVRQLEYFLAVVDHGGFNKGAKALFMAQPSLSQAIKALEKDLGSRLFHRIGRRVVLTDAGRALIEPARQVVRSLEVARASVAAVQGLVRGSVVIASMPSPAVEPLSSMVGRFCERHPGVEVVIRDAPVPKAVIELVRTGEAELGLLSAWELPAVTDVTLHPVEEQRFVIVAPPDGPFEPARSLPRERLAGQRLIVGEHGTGLRRLIDEIRASGVELSIAVESEHREAFLPLVLKGVGIGVLAEAWRPIAERAGALVFELDPPASLHLALVGRKGWLTPAAEAFLSVALTYRPSL
ncbi:DNA-binding transcriptional regulator, LysR family [Nonomuraea solani]|uniref:DNA-binding transcriptional regulator, LysR family n=1 Tax=Nonomuraea solani TaxID=1144553 RepID=A0A1H6EWX4_9ACTN|nr:LysR family transcriptional regulator [Nonomuraea solani]SEH01591.1 DNA-binding transcriptional regulator, LysR family [Nonomuraea solani]